MSNDSDEKDRLIQGLRDLVADYGSARINFMELILRGRALGADIEPGAKPHAGKEELRALIRQLVAAAQMSLNAEMAKGVQANGPLVMALSKALTSVKNYGAL
jgi:hypothetical protein